MSEVRIKCSKCNGVGLWGRNNESCARCRGSGLLDEARLINLRDVYFPQRLENSQCTIERFEFDMRQVEADFRRWREANSNIDQFTGEIKGNKELEAPLLLTEADCPAFQKLNTIGDSNLAMGSSIYSVRDRAVKLYGEPCVVMVTPVSKLKA